MDHAGFERGVGVDEETIGNMIGRAGAWGRGRGQGTGAGWERPQAGGGGGRVAATA